jgi:hypothetical protein
VRGTQYIGDPLLFKFFKLWEQRAVKFYLEADLGADNDEAIRMFDFRPLGFIQSKQYA